MFFSCSQSLQPFYDLMQRDRLTTPAVTTHTVYSGGKLNAVFVFLNNTQPYCWEMIHS